MRSTLIARDLVGNLQMVSVSDNTAALLDYRLFDAHERGWLFQFGKLTDRTFRETRQIIFRGECREESLRRGAQ